MAWRNCAASLALIAEVNARWPDRDKTSDGTIGDAAHATRESDHNPFIIVDGTGVVRARDIDKDGIDAPWLAEYLRTLGAAGDPRLTGGGYVIFNRRITMPNWTGWRVYTGVNPHDKHIHVSFSLNRAGFDSTAGWGITGASTPTAGGPELDATERKMLEEVHDEITKRLPSRADYALIGQPVPAQRVADTVFGSALNADARAFEARELVRGLRGDVASLTRLVESQQAALEAVARLAGQGGGSTADQIKAAVTEALQQNTVQVEIAVAGRS